MKLNLTDFTQLKNISENLEEKENGNNLEKEIEALKNQINQLLKQIEVEKKNAYKKGFEDAIKSLKEKYKNALEQKIKEIEASFNDKYNAEIKQAEDTIEKIQNALKQHYQIYLAKISEIISDSIAEILEFLYIHEKDPKEVAEKINEILEELREFKVLKIKISKDQNLELLQKFLSSVSLEIDENLKGNDFIIEFDNGKIENKFREKIEIVKDEIKREIKKLSEI
ncbi:FliH/SctL family protein [Sulfurihydrogenibium sp.]|jgi:vacuolar-type H+-ATPase subunit E/Vma4|uniref:FliH/SctL family protein n=1 Tax=Sulfurihydrogenibium sp. TaxID=2053621 RepID=UPI0026347EDB|nr:FliH/SctL family protein [Sulfurihydrogenibium sp.]